MCNACDLLDDDLPAEWTFGDRAYDPNKAAKVAALTQTTPIAASFTEDCKKCRGSGRFVSWAGRDCGPCRACKGKGKLTFKTSPEQRQYQRNQKQRRAETAVETWIDEHLHEWRWVLERRERFDFAASMFDAVNKYHHLTDNQLAAVRRCMLRDAERKERFERERVEREKNAVTVNIGRIEEALLLARGNQVRWPKLRLDTFVFSLAGEQSRNPGAVYVKDKETDAYLGKIIGGKFTRSHDCTVDHETRIVTAASDPEAAAKAYGQRFGACSICGRELTVSESIDRAMGPICAAKYGWA
jgi:hypothetical protein